MQFLFLMKSDEISYREFLHSTASTSRRWRRVIIIQGWQLVAKKFNLSFFPPLLSSPSRHIFNVEFYEITRGPCMTATSALSKVQKEYRDRQIAQKVEFYRMEEKQLWLYFDQFCNLLPLKHVLQ